MKIIAWLAGIGTFIAAGVYMIVSLNRWEWNRALFFGLIFVAAEIGLATGLIIRRIGRLERRVEPDPEILEVLRVRRPPSRDRFAWLKKSAGKVNVFITFVVGGGLILSGIAWVIDRG